MKKALLLSLLFVSGVVGADFLDGKELKKSLDAYNTVSSKNPGSRLGAGTAIGYVSGVWDTGYYQTFCPGRGVKQSQAIAVAQKYLDKHPQRLDEPAKTLLLEAFIESYPCKPR
ncbi:MAG: Rap1a/Tai family immunity protein [Pseudomonadota bacterium]